MGEICRLRVDDIDAEPMVLRIRSATCRRERHVMPSARLLRELRAYWKPARLVGPVLLPGNAGRIWLTRAAIHKAVAGAARRATLRKRVSPADIERCRTAALGGHLDVCTACAYEQPVYNSCRNRHCPKCHATKDETELLVKICQDQQDEKCLDACAKKLGRKIRMLDGGVPASAKNSAPEHKKPDTDLARA